MGGFDKQQIKLIAVLLMCTAGIGIFRIVPLLRQRVTLNETMQQHTRRLEEIQIQSDRLSQLADRLAHEQSQAALFDQRIAAERSFAQLWQQIADLMNQYNLTDQHVRPGQPIENAELGAISLTLSAVGSMHDFWRFFKAIEQSERLIRFERVELTNDGVLADQGKLEAKAIVYYQPEHTQG